VTTMRNGMIAVFTLVLMSSGAYAMMPVAPGAQSDSFITPTATTKVPRSVIQACHHFKNRAARAKCQQEHMTR
jgi:hypothetical protein